MFQTTPVDLTRVFEIAIQDALARLGRSYDLPPIAWAVVHNRDGVRVEGAANEATCDAWARRIGLVENNNEWPGRSWRSNNGQWEVELLSF